MPRPPFPKTLREFQQKFATEEACQQCLAACCWPDGFVWPRCGKQRAYELVKIRRWQYAGCRHQVAPGGPSDRQSAAIVDRDSSRRESRAAPGLPRRICLSPQPTTAALGGVPDPARPGNPAQAYALQGNTGAGDLSNHDQNPLGLAETTG